MKSRMVSLILGIVIMITILGFQLLTNSGTTINLEKDKSNKNSDLRSVVEVVKSGMEKIITKTIKLN